jgi:hypothetical protein
MGDSGPGERVCHWTRTVFGWYERTAACVNSHVSPSSPTGLGSTAPPQADARTGVVLGVRAGGDCSIPSQAVHTLLVKLVVRHNVVRDAIGVEPPQQVRVRLKVPHTWLLRPHATLTLTQSPRRVC